MKMKNSPMNWGKKWMMAFLMASFAMVSLSESASAQSKDKDKKELKRPTTTQPKTGNQPPKANQQPHQRSRPNPVSKNPQTRPQPQPQQRPRSQPQPTTKPTTPPPVRRTQPKPQPQPTQKPNVERGDQSRRDRNQKPNTGWYRRDGQNNNNQRPDRDRTERRDRDYNYRRDNDRRDNDRRDRDNNRRPDWRSDGNRDRRDRHDRELDRNSWFRQRHDSVRKRYEHFQDHRDLVARIDRYRIDFDLIFRDRHEARRRVIIQNSAACHDWYHGYRRYGFRGGFYYTYRPVVNVSVHFENPLWSWFYLDVIDHDCHRAWYGTRYEPTTFTVFRYRRVYHPTVEFQNLVIGISDLDYDSQYRFRLGMENLTDKLGQRLANLTNMSVRLDEDDVVVTNYQVIEDRAVVLEGYVDHAQTRFAFKGFVNLRNVQDTMLFVPSNIYGEPAYAELDELRMMNDRILDLGGSVDRD